MDEVGSQGCELVTTHELVVLAESNGFSVLCQANHLFNQLIVTVTFPWGQGRQFPGYARIKRLRSRKHQHNLSPSNCEYLPAADGLWPFNPSSILGISF